MTIDDIIKIKTLAQWCTYFGWQGGTIHQVRDELKTFYSQRGIVARKGDGVLCAVSFDQPRQSTKVE